MTRPKHLLVFIGTQNEGKLGIYYCTALAFSPPSVRVRVPN
jgi:hypothetical protein